LEVSFDFVLKNGMEAFFFGTEEGEILAVLGVLAAVGRKSGFRFGRFGFFGLRLIF
jgi:hypothetical protein